MQEQRDERRCFLPIAQEADREGGHRTVKRERLFGAGPRMSKLDGCRRRELGHQRFEVAFGVRERFRAAIVFRTAFDQEVERTLRVSSHIHAEHFRRRSDAIQDDAPHAIGELARVADGGARPVGDAVKVDALISERIAHVVEIFHRDRRRIEAGGPRRAPRGTVRPTSASLRPRAAKAR